jgi:nicotinate-nucleotide--dimethylbenzimidazole phosphoribosyltransferase
MVIPAIPSLYEECQQAALARQSILTKPAGALGRLEALSVQMAGITGRLDWLPTKRLAIVCAADHGVAAQGVSAYPAEVTCQMVLNFLRGGAAINVLARQMNARVLVIDAGVTSEIPPHPDLVSARIGRGTADFTCGPAMTDEQAAQSIDLGLRIAREQIAKGVNLLAVGEMGIANTTSASAIIAAITGQSAEAVTGHGTGIDDQGLTRKIAVIEQALMLHAPASQQTLARLGGFEIGCMAGLMLGAASARVPVLIDGLISTAAAMIATQFAPRVVDYLIASHAGAEPGHRIALEYLGLDPLLSLNLRLGEGTGAVLAMPLVEAAMRTLQEMATFDAAGVSGPA